MSAYHVHKVCRRILHDPTFRALAKDDPHAALAKMELHAEERKALLAGDVGWLYRNGASAFLLLILSRFEIFGLSLSIFNQQMRAENKQ